jgi:hypothetical protein
MSTADGKKKRRVTWLKASISLDLSQDDDRRLLAFVDELPNGQKGSVLRRLLTQSLPRNDVDLERLLGQTQMDARARGQTRGRPRRAALDYSAAVEAVAPPILEKSSRFARETRPETPEVPVGQASPEVPVEQTEELVSAASQVPDGLGAVAPEKTMPVSSAGQEPSSGPRKQRVQIGGLIPSWQT